MFTFPKKQKITTLLLTFVVATIGTFNTPLHAKELIPTKFDKSHEAAREQAYTPWIDGVESGKTWSQLSATRIPVAVVRKYTNHQELSRYIYLPRLNAGYWTMDRLSKEEFFNLNKERTERGEVLVDAEILQYENGKKYYRGVWINPNEANAFLKEMTNLGITRAQIKYTFNDYLQDFSKAINPYVGVIVLLIFIFTIIAIILLGAVIFQNRFTRN